jgi:ATP/maltotriose-dependent transcriptional regulator MalT
VDSDRWVALMRAELASLAGDYDEAARCCEAVLATIADNGAPWWESLRAQVKARLAVALLRQGHQERCARLLRESLNAAAPWWERPATAALLDACALYALSGDPGHERRTADAEQAARLLGAAHAARGAFDESSLDAPAARAQAREALGEEAFAAAYESALASGYEPALALAREFLSAVP